MLSYLQSSTHLRHSVSLCTHNIAPGTMTALAHSCVATPCGSLTCRPQQSRQRAVHIAASAAETRKEPSQTSRRQLLTAAPLLAAAAGLLPAPARAEGEEQPAAAATTAAAPSSSSGSTTTYTDEQDKFTITVPASWAAGTGQIGDAGGAPLNPQARRFSNGAGLQRVVAWYVPELPAVSVAVTVGPSSYEFTGLGSLGRAEDFAQAMVSRMDQSFLLRTRRRPGGEPLNIAKLLDARESKGRYLVDYTLQREGEEARMVMTAVAVGYNGRVPRFYTLNASCPQSQLAAYEDTLRQIVSSFSAPSPVV